MLLCVPASVAAQRTMSPRIEGVNLALQLTQNVLLYGPANVAAKRTMTPRIEGINRGSSLHTKSAQASPVVWLQAYQSNAC